MLHVLIVLLVAPSAIAQTETRVMVRAVAKDAKIIGSGVGGARIVIQDAATGDVLAAGIQQGTTGDTRKIVIDPIVRGEAIYDTDEAAGFMASLTIDTPTVVDITAYGPLETPERMYRTTKRMLLVPGQDVLGNGIILELNGFTVQIVEPPNAEPLRAGSVLDVTSEITMLCGCPTEPGGLWDADDIEVVAQLVHDGKVVADAALEYAGRESTFSGQIDVPDAGAYMLRVLASEAAEGNFGIEEQAIVVER